MRGSQRRFAGASIVVLMLAAPAMSQDAACGDCCCATPKWQVRAGAIFLDREDPEPGAFLTGGFPEVAPLVDYSTFGFDMEGGWEISVARELNRCWALEARYFQVDAWSSRFDESLDPGLYFVRYQSTLLGTGGSSGDESRAVSGYGSELHSFELLARRKLGCVWNISAGFRCLEADDDLHVLITNVDSGGSSAQRFAADNRLYGFQAGLEGILLHRGRLRIDGIGKAGVYGNDVDARIQARNRTEFGDFDLDRPGWADQTSFVGEAGLFATYALTSRLALRGGYQVLYLTGLAVADDLPRINESSGAVSVRTDTTLFYHGASIGLECRF